MPNAKVVINTQRVVCKTLSFNFPYEKNKKMDSKKIIKNWGNKVWPAKVSWKLSCAVGEKNVECTQWPDSLVKLYYQQKFSGTKNYFKPGKNMSTTANHTMLLMMFVELMKWAAGTRRELYRKLTIKRENVSWKFIKWQEHLPTPVDRTLPLQGLIRSLTAARFGISFGPTFPHTHALLSILPHPVDSAKLLNLPQRTAAPLFLVLLARIFLLHSLAYLTEKLSRSFQRHVKSGSRRFTLFKHCPALSAVCLRLLSSRVQWSLASKEGTRRKRAWEL